MSHRHPSQINRNTGTVQGNQNNVSGSYTDNSRTDRRETHYYPNGPPHGFSPSHGYGPYNGVPYSQPPVDPRYQPGPPPYSPTDSSYGAQVTEEPGAMQGVPSSRGGSERYQGPAQGNGRSDSLSGLFALYDRPSPDARQNPPGGGYPLSGPNAYQPYHRGYTLPTPHRPTEPPYHPSSQAAHWSDPAVPTQPHLQHFPVHPHSLGPAGHPATTGYQADPQAQPRAPGREMNPHEPPQRRSRRETNPFIPIVEEERRRRGEKPMGFFN